MDPLRSPAAQHECWQSDVTSWKLSDGTDVEIVDAIDDHSRLCVASCAVLVAKANDVVAILREAGARLGFPASVLTDNGRVYTTWSGGSPNPVQIELLGRGIIFKHSRPITHRHAGRSSVSTRRSRRFWPNIRRRRSRSCRHIDRFVDYNEVRPHRSCNRMTPQAAWDDCAKARPQAEPLRIGDGVRVRSDRIDKIGCVSLRYRTRLHHIGVGRDHVVKRVFLLIDGLDIRVLTHHGELLRRLTFDSNKIYQGTGRPPGPPKGRYKGRRF